MSQPTDASNEGEVMPNKPDNAVETTATDGRANAVTGDGASDQHASDAERAEVEALNARVAMLREVLERLRECFDDGGEYDGHALVPVEGFTERVKAAEAALSGTGTDWLDQLKEQVVSETLDSAIAAVKAGMRIEWLRVPKLGSADAPEGRDG